MKSIFALLIILWASSVYSAALIHPTPTQIDIVGVIGEDGVMKSLCFRLVAKLIDQKSYAPHNIEALGSLEVTVGKTKLKIPPIQYNNIKNVSLNRIRLEYIKSLVGESSIEIYIPFGDYNTCTNCDNITNYSQREKVLIFNDSGEFLNAKFKEICSHLGD